jgi:hypothetical protein
VVLLVNQRPGDNNPTTHFPISKLAGLHAPLHFETYPPPASRPGCSCIVSSYSLFFYYGFWSLCNPSPSTSHLPLSGITCQRQISPAEGPLLAVQPWGSNHTSSTTYSGISCSTTSPDPHVLLYLTERGGVHGWDMRQQRDAWVIPSAPHLGACTHMLPDPQGRTWLMQVWGYRYYSMPYTLDTKPQTLYLYAYGALGSGFRGFISSRITTWDSLRG